MTTARVCVHPILIVGCVILFIGALLNTVGYLTPDWFVSRGVSKKEVGLFQTCTELMCISNADAFNISMSDLQILQGCYLGSNLCSWLSSISNVFILTALGAGKEIKALPRFADFMTWIMFFCFSVTAMCLFCFEFIDQQEDYSVGYSLWLCIAGINLIFIGGVISRVGRCFSPTRRSQPDELNLITSPLGELSNTENYLPAVTLPPYSAEESPPGYEESQC